MKTLLLAAAAALAFTGPAFAQDIIGLWATPTNGGRVEISRCGNSLCGKLMTSERIKTDPSLKDVKNREAGQRDRALKGLQMLYDFTGGPTKWTGGKVYNPDDGRTYSGAIEMTSPDSLKLKGCVVAPLCKTQVWTRVR